MMSHSPSPEPSYSWSTEDEINSFIKHLNKSKRILALCGAGLSAPSGIPTFKGSGTLWKNHKAAVLSNIDTFEANPGLVWCYFADRRRLALKAKPNRAHLALAEVARKRNGFICLTQNIDDGMELSMEILTHIGLSQRAKHPKDRLYELHGSLMDIKCSNNECDYIDKENLTEPLCSALAADSDEPTAFSAKRTSFSQPSTDAALVAKLSTLTVEEDPKYKREPNALEAILESLQPTITPEMRKEVIPESELPHCPKCCSLLRPGVVWFGEPLSQSMFDQSMHGLKKRKSWT